MAVDPGRDKSGIAIIDNNRKIYFKDIVITDNISSVIRPLLADYTIDMIVIGDGTYCEEIRKIISRQSKIPISIVNEAYSTVEAEKKYRQEKQNCLFRLVKWKPSCPLDDYVAVILAERYLKNNSGQNFQ